MTPERATAPANAGAEGKNSRASTTQGNHNGSNSGYNASQRLHAKWANKHAKRWERPAGHATAEQVEELKQEVLALKRLLTGEQIP